MLRHCLLLSLLLAAACSDESEPELPEPTPIVDNTDRPAAPVVETLMKERKRSKPADILLRAVPADALLCAHLPDLERAWTRLGGTVFGPLISNVDFAELAMQLRPAYEQLCNESGAPGTTRPPSWEDVETIFYSLNGEIMVSLLDLDGFDAKLPELQVLAGISVFGAESETSRLFDYVLGVAARQRGIRTKKRGKVWEIRSSDSPYVFEIGVDRDVALFAIGAGTVEAAMQRLRSNADAFAMTSTRCFKPNDISRFHLNVARVFERYSGQMPAEVLQALKSIRLDRVRGVSGAMRIEKQNFAVSTFYDSPGGHDFFTRFLAANQVDYSLLTQIPRQLESFSLFTFDPAWIVRNLRTGLPPEQAAALQQALESVVSKGLDLSERTLATIGPQCAQIGLPNLDRAKTGPRAVLGAVNNTAWLIQIKNPDLVERFLDQIGGYLPARRKYRIGRTEAMTFSLGMRRMPGFSLDPSFAVTPSILYVALSEFSLRRALKRGSTDSAMRYRKLLSEVPDSVTSVTYDSMKSPGMLGMAILAGLQQARGNDQLSLFKSAMANLTPAIAYTTADETGIFSHTLSPTASLSGIGGIFGISIVASIAIPNLLKARTAANESAAIATLAAIRSAQEQFRVQNLRDHDDDGRGEYGFLAELMDPPSGEPLMPKFPGASGRYMRSGYIFRVFLPGRGGKAVGETRDLSSGVETNLAEKFFVAAAWPVDNGKTGRRTFVMNTHGEIFFCAEGPYGGRNQPAPDILSFEPGNLVSRTLQDGMLARDGQRWFRVR